MLSDRDLERIARALDNRRFDERDIEFRRYVRPDGRDIAVMQARPGGVEFAVATPGQTFKPGTRAPTGSKTGRPGELLLQTPAIGQRGTANFPPISQQTTLPGVCVPPTIESADPVVFFPNHDPTFIDTVVTGTGFEFGMSVLLINQTTPGLFVVSNVLTLSSTQVAFRVTEDSAGPTSDSADLRIVNSCGAAEEEEFATSSTF